MSNSRNNSPTPLIPSQILARQSKSWCLVVSCLLAPDSLKLILYLRERTKPAMDRAVRTRESRSYHLAPRCYICRNLLDWRNTTRRYGSQRGRGATSSTRYSLPHGTARCKRYPAAARMVCCSAWRMRSRFLSVRPEA